jgi:hypothetical protein
MSQEILPTALILKNFCEVTECGLKNGLLEFKHLIHAANMLKGELKIRMCQLINVKDDQKQVPIIIFNDMSTLIITSWKGFHTITMVDMGVLFKELENMCDND